MKIKKNGFSKFLSVIVVMSLIITMFSGMVLADSWNGSSKVELDIVEGAYQISTANELAWFAEQVNKGYTEYSAELVADIDLRTVDTFKNLWTPIGTGTYKYSGTFKGNGHTIEGLFINAISTKVGLFGYLSGASIEGIYLKDVEINISGYNPSENGLQAHMGTLAGYVTDATRIFGCGVSGSIRVSCTSADGNIYVGGLVGYLQARAIESCYSTVTVEKYNNSMKFPSFTGCFTGNTHSVVSSYYTNEPFVCNNTQDAIKIDVNDITSGVLAHMLNDLNLLSNGEEYSVEKNVTYGAKYSDYFPITNPELTNYEFKGWDVSDEDTIDPEKLNVNAEYDLKKIYRCRIIFNI